MITPITQFVVELCRKFNLLYNERTTLLSCSDQFQLVQYCLALSKKQKEDEFDASPMETIEMANAIQDFHLGQLEQHFNECEKSTLSSETEVEPSVEQSVAGSETVMESDLGDVLQLYVSDKERSNLCSLLDCYIKFVEQILKSDSHLVAHLKENVTDISLSCDTGHYHKMQMRLGKILQTITPNIHLEDVSLAIAPNESGMSISATTSYNVGITPKRITLTGGIDAEATPRQVSSPATITSTPKTPATQSHRRGRLRVFIQDTFSCYLHLLVNPRSQLALARVFNTPDRGLEHTSFTHIKHESHTSGLSMYQCITSFVLRVRLGGKGYAPAADTPWMSDIKGLSDLCDMIQKLQTIVEEVPDIRSACRRVVNVIRGSLVRCKSGRYPANVVENCATNVLDALVSIIDHKENTLAGRSPEKPTNAGGSVMGRQCLHVLQTYLDSNAVKTSAGESGGQHGEMLSDISFSSQTPTRIPCLLTQFRSPCILEDNETVESYDVDKRVTKKTAKISNFVSSALYLGEDDISDDIGLTQNTLVTCTVLPSLTLVETREDNSKTSATTVSALNDVTDGINNKVNKTEHADKKASKRGRQKRCLDGQENPDSIKGLVDDKTRHKHKAAQIIDNKLGSVSGEVSNPKCSKMNKTNGKETQSVKKGGKSCRKLVLPQVKGQSKITGFFKM